MGFNSGFKGLNDFPAFSDFRSKNAGRVAGSP